MTRAESSFSPEIPGGYRQSDTPKVFGMGMNEEERDVVMEILKQTTAAIVKDKVVQMMRAWSFLLFHTFIDDGCVSQPTLRWNRLSARHMNLVCHLQPSLFFSSI